VLREDDARHLVCRAEHEVAGGEVGHEDLLSHAARLTVEAVGEGGSRRCGRVEEAASVRRGAGEARVVVWRRAWVVV